LRVITKKAVCSFFGPPCRCPENFRDSLDTPTATFHEIFWVPSIISGTGKESYELHFVRTLIRSIATKACPLESFVAIARIKVRTKFEVRNFARS